MDGVVVMGSDGVVLDWNHRAEEIFGWPRDEIVGQEMGSHIIPAQHRQAHIEGLKTYFATGDGPLLQRRFEITALRKSGEEFPIELSISPIVRGDQTIFLGFARDLSERRAAERVLELQTREAVLLHQVTTLAAETSSRDEALKLCLESVCDLTGWPAGHAYLVGPDGVATSAVWVGDPQGFEALHHALTVARTTQTGLPQQTFQPAAPCWIAEVSADDPMTRSPQGEDFGIRAAFGFPIVIADEVVAVLEFFSPVPVAPDPNLLLSARTMGDQVGRVIERRRVQDHQALLLAELDHRARNMLAVVMAMAAQTARATTSIDEFKTSFFSRLNAFSRAYGLLTAKNWRPTSLESLVTALAEPHLGKDRPQLEISGSPLMLPPKMALAMSMILHELLTNAAKYGALSTKTGAISLTSGLERRPKGDIARLEWRERGVPGLVAPAGFGFGTKLIETSIRHELGGHVTTTYGPDGVEYTFEFPQPL